MEKRTLNVGDVVQIDPAHDPRFGSCFMLVTEPKHFGAQGYVKVPGGGLAFYRVSFEHIELIGQAVWIREKDMDDRDEEKSDNA